MPQTTITLSQHDLDVIRLIAEETGESFSSVCSRCIQHGLYSEIERLNKAQHFIKSTQEFKKTRGKERIDSNEGE